MHTRAYVFAYVCAYAVCRTYAHTPVRMCGCGRVRLRARVSEGPRKWPPGRLGSEQKAFVPASGEVGLSQPPRP